MSYQILVVDDDHDNLVSTSALLEQWGYRAETAKAGEEALAKISSSEFAVILLDYRMPGKNGVAVAKDIRQMTEEPIILMYSCDDTREPIKEALRAGFIEDFIDKDEDIESLRRSVAEACRKYETSTRLLKTSSSKTAVEELISSIGMVGRSSALAEVARKTLKYKKSKEPVLIIGESGVGKELVARAVHDGPPSTFFAVTGAAYGENSNLLETELFGHEKGSFTGAVTSKVGMLELGNRGTVFFDELHKLNLEAQAKLLRAFQEKKIRRVGGHKEIFTDFRIVTAVQPDIEDLINSKSFLPDLFYRIKVLTIDVPPLRERPEDIEPLVLLFTENFQKKSGQKKSFTMQAVRHMERYSWPGNIRELEGVVTQLLTDSTSDKVNHTNLESHIRQDASDERAYDFALLKHRQEMELRQYVTNVLRTSKSAAHAAERLGIPATTLYSMLNKFGIRKDMVG